ncbi:hypothetical protein AWN90_11465 [Nocardia terpenica]|uniref:Gp28/Gp37-like domain-containing protein n=2 Tax=Nocardia terpenica TaxID=455432 RepID=A0A164HG17_9NOCA|nr:hypothetical protein AWN90_11465 [Nocardia terpenica]
MSVITTLDFESIYRQVQDKKRRAKMRRTYPSFVRLWDGRWRLRGRVTRYSDDSTFEFIDGDTGIGVLEMPHDYYLARWLINVEVKGTNPRVKRLDGTWSEGPNPYGRYKDLNAFVTVDRDGARWSGVLSECSIIKDDNGRRIVRATFKHDFEFVRRLRFWSNPVLPAQIQVPRYWLLWGRAIPIIKITMFLNLLRLNASPFRIPDNPLDFEHWLDPIKGLDLRNWNMVVKPQIEPDTSVTGLLFSRFQSAYEATKTLVDDAQLSWDLRRWLKGDPEPWPGAFIGGDPNRCVVKHGALIVDLKDRSAWSTGTAAGGNILQGLTYSIQKFLPNGMNGAIEETTIDPNLVTEYTTPGLFKGTVPRAPAVVFRESKHGGIQTSEVTWRPPTVTNIVGGGHSMMGVNEALRATITALGDLTAMIPGVPPIGGVLEIALTPFVEDTLMAWGKWESTDRKDRLGDSFLWEDYAEGSENIYSISGALAMRKGFLDTDEELDVKVTVADGSPWRIGQNGYGHFFLGDRIGVAPLGVSPGQIFIQRVSSLKLKLSPDTAAAWEITLGRKRATDPILGAWERLSQLASILQMQGVL